MFAFVWCLLIRHNLFFFVCPFLLREAIKEDDDGLLDGAIAELIQKAKRKRQAQKTLQNKLGMMRHLYLLLDCSESMSVPDLKPTRLICTLKVGYVGLEVAVKCSKISDCLSGTRILCVQSKIFTKRN